MKPLIFILVIYFLNALNSYSRENLYQRCTLEYFSSALALAISSEPGSPHRAIASGALRKAFHVFVDQNKFENKEKNILEKDFHQVVSRLLNAFSAKEISNEFVTYFEIQTDSIGMRTMEWPHEKYSISQFQKDYKEFLLLREQPQQQE